MSAAVSIRRSSSVRSARICFSGPTTGTSARRSLPISAASMSRWMTSRPGGECAQLAGDAVVEPGADRDEQIARVHRQVRPLRPMHPGPAEVELVRLGEGALGHQCGDDRQPPDRRELEQFGAGVGVQRAAADVQDGLVGGRDASGCLGDLPGVAARRRPPARQVDLVGVPEVERSLLDVARDVDQHRAAAPGPGDVERRLHDARDLLDVLNEPRVLDDRRRHARDVALLERVGADQMAAYLAGDADERRRVHPGIGDRRDEIGCARSGGCERDSDPP